jgi:hypothetical protein
MWWHVHLSSQSQQEVQVECCSPGKHGQKERPHLQNNRIKKGWGVLQAVEPLANKHETLSSNHSTTTKKKKKKYSLGW